MSLEWAGEASPRDSAPEPAPEPARASAIVESSGSGAGSARRVLDDPLVLRAFAHPVRLELHRLLIREGRCSAAYAAREVGISQALASHHLHQLAKYGFAEQVVGKDRRERPWQPLSRSTTWLGADRTDEGASAADLLEQTLAEQSVSNLLSWQRRRRSIEAHPWHDQAGLDTNLLYLTPAEAAALAAEFESLCRPYLERSHDVDTAHRPADRDELRPVEVTLLVVPLEPTATGA